MKFEFGNETVKLVQGQRSPELDFFDKDGALVHSQWTSEKLVQFAGKLPAKWQLFYLKQLPDLGSYEQLPKELKQAFVAIDSFIATEAGTLDKVPSDTQKSLVKAIFSALAKTNI